MGLSSPFFAALSRLKFIQRWGLMHNTRAENVQEHSHQVTLIAHALALISNKYYGGHYDANRIAIMAALHDASEVITGDVPTPVKYFSEDVRDAFKAVEAVAERHLLGMLPQDLQEDYCDLICSDRVAPEDRAIIKAADMLSAYLKCVEELKAGNSEFELAEESLATRLYEVQQDIPAVEYFIQHFAGAFKHSLDKQLDTKNGLKSFGMKSGVS